MTPPIALQAHGHGIFCLDADYVRPQFDAIHIIVEAGRAALIDTGTQYAVPRIMAALAALGLDTDAVDWVILTHIHLDHAGGAGALMRRLPHAQLVVHPRGAPHMIDPSRLWQGTVAVYGAAQAQRLYGALLPIPAERVVAAADGDCVSLAGRPLRCLDAPGHARHHLMVWDEACGALFTGDTFGLSYREFDVAGRAFVLPSSTPVHFDPHAMTQTLQRIQTLAPPAVYLTHWSRLAQPTRYIPEIIERVAAYARLAQMTQDRVGNNPAVLIPALEEGMAQLLLRDLAAHGCTLAPETQRALLDLDIRLNAAGLLCWLQQHHPI